MDRSARAAEDFIVPILEQDEKQAPAMHQADERDTTVDGVQHLGDVEIDVNMDTGEFRDARTGEALTILSTMPGHHGESLRRKLWLKYLATHVPPLFKQFARICVETKDDKVRERRLNEHLEKTKRLLPDNPWNPAEKKIVIT